MDEYIAYLQKIGKKTDSMIGEAVYAMANVVANAIRSNIQSLPTNTTEEDNIKAYKRGEKSRLTDKEKNGLLEGFGVSPMKNDMGFIHVKLGFDGYNSVKTKKYPSGHPNALIARITESGSPYRDKTPFVRTATAKTKDPAIQAAQSVIDKKLSE